MGFAKKVAKFASASQPHSWLLDKKTNASIDFGGQVLGVYDDLYKPKDVQPIPSANDTGTGVDATTAENVAADRMRRLAKRASGIDSTIRTSPAGATLYSPQPKALLGS